MQMIEEVKTCEQKSGKILAQAEEKLEPGSVVLLDPSPADYPWSIKKPASEEAGLPVFSTLLLRQCSIEWID